LTQQTIARLTLVALVLVAIAGLLGGWAWDDLRGAW
jgi:hypothetical protein